MTRERRLLTPVLLATTALVLAGCGGSDSAPSSVGDCQIEAGTSCPGADLSGADLSGADLSAADLSGATLDATNLSSANLSEAKLNDAQITNADFSDADLAGASLQGATITGTSFDGATLCGTIRTDGTTDDSSCPPSTETTDTTPVAAEVTSFVAGALTCEGENGAVTVSWTTSAATAVRLDVDGEEAAETGPSGTQQLDVPCDGQAHEVSITPLSDEGEGETVTRNVGPSGG